MVLYIFYVISFSSMLLYVRKREAKFRWTSREMSGLLVILLIYVSGKTIERIVIDVGLKDISFEILNQHYLIGAICILFCVKVFTIK